MAIEPTDPILTAVSCKVSVTAAGSDVLVYKLADGKLLKYFLDEAQVLLAELKELTSPEGEAIYRMTRGVLIAARVAR